MATARTLFGTDGIRGTANRHPVTAETVLRLGIAAGIYFNRGAHRHRVVIAKDTRLSGYMLEPALTAGLTSTGMDVILVGPLPTPAVARLTHTMRADLGMMISASHNPFQDNGIKLFGPDGFKLSDEAEAAIEALMRDPKALEKGRADPDKLGRAKRLEDARGRYIEAVKRSYPRRRTLGGLRIVIDCAHGAAYQVGPTILFELGAEVIPLGIEPDGFNINDGCGSTHTEALRKRVVAEKADLGIALDGDADRLVMCDEEGQLIDGDQVMAMIATHYQETERLRGGAVVATQMSNLGLERYLKSRDIGLVRTKVGDRYVIEAMRRGGYNVGGEQSGHMILSDYATTGDGLVAALQVLGLLCQSEKKLSEIARMFTPLPQLLINVRYDAAASDPLETQPVQEAMKDAHAALGDAGRIFVRKSGTEPLIRIMVEGEEESRIRTLGEELAGVIRDQKADA